MILDSRSDLFRVEIPKVFLPDFIKNKYSPYIHRMPTIISDASDLINASIQTVTVPAVSFDPVTQARSSIKSNPPNRRRGDNRTFRDSKDPNSLVEKTFTITFKLYDGFINYWILLEAFYYYYNPENFNTYTFDIPVRIHDSEGNLMYSIKYKDVLFTGMSQFELSYSDNIQQFKTFECNFTYNEFDFNFEI
tara:strand:- start:1077 stop:1652 length:576 start_codon:yes stop_codon:yes gene_type:complete